MPSTGTRDWNIVTHPGTGKYEQLLERCRGLAPIPTAVAYPCEETLSAAIDAGTEGLIVPFWSDRPRRSPTSQGEGH
jgi:hypothetical protein